MANRQWGGNKNAAEGLAWRFPKIWGAFGGVPIMRTIVFLVFILGSPPSGETTISGVGFKKGVDDP